MKYPYVRRLPKFEYLAPDTLEEAITILSQHDGEARPIAGGTDLLLNMKRREIIPQYLVGLKNIPGLDRIAVEDGQGLRIGPLVTIHAVEVSSAIRERFPILSQAASTLGSIQIRNLGTVVGNVCNAMPSADMIPSLVVLGAKLKILSGADEKLMAIEDFFTGVGKSVLAPHELVGELQVPHPPAHSGGTYIKYAQRGAKALGICNVATWITMEDDICSEAKICMGAVGQTVIRALEAEDILRGKPITSDGIREAAEKASRESQPRSSLLRGSAEYRKEMVKVLTERALKMSREQVK